ncbi:uncharacterized protein LOC21407845 [Morus notabilis]|uniref:uncharacterized protein LOC21407845 n=1 Tax=Morus notabilis TaxID=981085 RepID=UPI000CED261B|nr:uncharacterized protein LOC21407845 [Morus notabilis]
MEALNSALRSADISDDKQTENDVVPVISFSDAVNDVTLHFQIIRLPRQIYAWIGCNSAKFGHLYAAAPTQPRNNGASVSCVLGGASDNTASGIARRLVLKSGLHVILASNIPKNSPLLEAEAEKMLVQKLISLGYTRPRSEASSSSDIVPTSYRAFDAIGVDSITMAAAPVFNDPNGVLRSISNVPPAHYTIKLQSFSLLMKNSIDRYASNQFEAGGYKWNLVIYPNGNKCRNVREYISLYLAMAEADSLQTGWEVYAVFRLFILNQNNDNYMVLQDVEGKERRFHRMKLEWGFDQFISLKVLNDSANGFLVDDTCVLGAEVFVCKERSTCKGECLQMIKDPITYKHSFWVYFSKLDVVCHESKEFNAADLKWKIRLYQKGKGDGLGTHLSLYLALVDSTDLPPGSKIYADFTLRILSQINTNNNFNYKASLWFSTRNEEYGRSRYITNAYFREPYLGYLVGDFSLFEAEVTVHGVVKPL